MKKGKNAPGFWGKKNDRFLEGKIKSEIGGKLGGFWGGKWGDFGGKRTTVRNPFIGAGLRWLLKVVQK